MLTCGGRDQGSFVKEEKYLALTPETFSKTCLWASLVAQWLRIHLPMQGTQVQALVRKIPHAAEQLSPPGQRSTQHCLGTFGPSFLREHFALLPSVTNSTALAPPSPQLPNTCPTSSPAFTATAIVLGWAPALHAPAISAANPFTQNDLLCVFLSFPFRHKVLFWASLVAQWLRIRLPMQGTRVQALVREDPTCGGATKPVHHSY
ncbi:hypothetical protein J1605_006448 [Eschrichtius robustus]|uniref:Uncharacterized protein n=1 Tax=Eschrichtius robustus TaxID=9764 RepID=A0AB34H1Q1_ESCRO|nr:hypothetical protein J1605_006448 [Eschrichtius robustus]